MKFLVIVVSILAIFSDCVKSFRTPARPLNRLIRSVSQQRMMNTPQLFDPSTMIPGLVVPSLNEAFLLSEEVVGYSSLSLYFTLALYVISLPGLYSLVTRSVKVSLTRKTFDLPGPANPTAKPLRQTAGEIMAFFKALNYDVKFEPFAPQTNHTFLDIFCATVAEDVITFKGIMGKSKSQAAFLTFCTFMGLGSLGLVLSILLPDVGASAYLLTLLSPYAGIFYWNNAQRVDEFVVKMETSDDDQITSIIAQGGKEDMERFSKALNLAERGKVYIQGIFDGGRETDILVQVPAALEATE